MTAAPGAPVPPPVTSTAVVSPTTHRGSLPRALRGAGRGCIAAAVLLLIAVLLRLPGAGWPRTLSDALAVVAVLAVLAAAGRAVLVALGRGPRLELTATGFRNRTRPPLPLPRSRSERRDGPWSDVRRLQAVSAGGRQLLVLTLGDSRRSVILLRRLATPPGDIEADVRARLDAANGYRPYGVLTAPPKAARPR